MSNLEHRFNKPSISSSIRNLPTTQAEEQVLGKRRRITINPINDESSITSRRKGSITRSSRQEISEDELRIAPQLPTRIPRRNVPKFLFNWDFDIIDVQLGEVI
jgi:hypothetical protein